jgi:hypothetical protein
MIDARFSHPPRPALPHATRTSSALGANFVRAEAATALPVGDHRRITTG